MTTARALATLGLSSNQFTSDDVHSAFSEKAVKHNPEKWDLTPEQRQSAEQEFRPYLQAYEFLLEQLSAMHKETSKFTEREARAVLGLDPNAGLEEIKKKYRDMARKIHPDKVPAEEQEAAKKKMQEVQEAYDLLTGKSAPAT